jgi:hypothetical protein
MLIEGAKVPQSAWRRATAWVAGVRLPTVASNFFLLHGVQIGYGAKQASYPNGTGALSSR